LYVHEDRTLDSIIQRYSGTHSMIDDADRIVPLAPNGRDHGPACATISAIRGNWRTGAGAHSMIDDVPARTR